MITQDDIFVSSEYDATTNTLTLHKHGGGVVTEVLGRTAQGDWTETNTASLGYIENKFKTHKVNSLTERNNLTATVRDVAIWSNGRIDVYMGSGFWQTIKSGPLPAGDIVTIPAWSAGTYNAGQVVRHKAPDGTIASVDYTGIDDSNNAIRKVAMTNPGNFKAMCEYNGDIYISETAPGDSKFRLSKYSGGDLAVAPTFLFELSTIDNVSYEFTISNDGDLIVYGEESGIRSGGWVFFYDGISTTKTGEFNIQSSAGTSNPVDREIEMLQHLPDGDLLIGTRHNIYRMVGLTSTIRNSSTQDYPSSQESSFWDGADFQSLNYNDAKLKKWDLTTLTYDTDIPYDRYGTGSKGSCVLDNKLIFADDSYFVEYPVTTTQANEGDGRWYRAKVNTSEQPPHSDWCVVDKSCLFRTKFECSPSCE